MKTMAVVTLTAVLTIGIAACNSSAQPRPRLGGGVSATCKLFWTYDSAHGIPKYPSYAAAYKADMVEYGHPTTPGYVYTIMPVLEPLVRITARSRVNVADVEVVFYDKSGTKTNNDTQVVVDKILTGGQSYTVDTAANVWALSDPDTGDTSVSSCAVTAWTRSGQN